MVTKLKKTTASRKKVEPVKSSVKDSAQQIWQAGLGAFGKAQAEGTKAFEALVKEGVAFQRKTQSAAEDKISEATSKMSHMATDISSKASGQWDKLESIFEERVAKALNKLGVPSSKDVSALVLRIDELNKSVQKLAAKGMTPAPTRTTARKAAPKAATKVALKVVAKAPASKAAKTVAKPATKRAAPRKVATTATVAPPAPAAPAETPA